MKKLDRWLTPIKEVWESVRQEKLGLYAAQTSFFLIISFVPLFMLLITLLQFILPITQDDLLNTVLPYLPENMEGFFSGIIGELFSKQTVSIISISSLMLLWSASRGIHSVTQGIRHIFRAPKTLYYRERLRALIYTVALVLTLLFALIVLVFGNSLWALLESNLPALKDASALVMLSKFAVSTLLITLFALLLYCATVPRGVSAARLQIPGALFAAAGWILFSTGFSIYITNFSNYSYVYGSLTAVILLMLWLYFCMWLLFLGAQLNKFLIDRREKNMQMQFRG